MPPANMSFLSERVLRSAAAPAARLAGVQTAAAPLRAFATSAARRKTPVQSVKDGLKTVDRAVSDNVVLPGLDAAAKAKDAAQNMTKGDVKSKVGEAKGKAQELAGQAQGKAQEMAGQAQGKAQQVAGQAEGTAQELKGEARGKAREAAGKAKGAADQAQSKL